MPDIKGMLPVGVIVITAIVALFVLAVVLLLYLSARYKFLSAAVAGSGDKSGGFLRYVKEDFSQAYKKYGQDVNTPALVANAVSVKLPGLLLIERFINNAVSLFVTLGLFGTFLGLSLSVSSLTELIGYSNTDQWLSVLDSVGTGLMSALSGMGVAFYTSLAGVACSIILTLLRSVFSPQAQREKLETQVELWLDHELAPTLPTERAKDDVQLVHQMIRALDSAAASMDRTLKQSTEEMKLTLAAAKEPLADFSRTVDGFNEGVRDFSEFDYNLRGTVERLDVCIRDLVGVLRSASRGIERSGRQ
ncbi:MAG TPA: MotA/TolQ/ExbB proton channel family protein [Candidatus Limivicinus faecipullorum]|nr:MotA/TolQ/ExbB proton channel family protein [Candidatus Limivicinus faecipullorum]